MRAALGRVGGIVLAAALATGFLAAPAQAEPSTITGTITSAPTGESLQGCANVYDLDYNYVSSGCTDDAGRWTAEGVETGIDYKVEVYSFDSLYRAQWSGGATTFDDAVVVEAPAQLDFALEYARGVGDSTLSGTITAEDTGAPLQACVTLADEADTYVASTCAAEDGTWTVGSLVAGAGYKVEFEAYDDVHVGEWAHDATSYADADLITAPATVDAALATGGHLQGTLTRADEQPAEGASVAISTADEDGQTAAFASTDQNGAWSALVRPGEYLVNFDSWPANQWAFGKTSREDAAHFTVAAGGTVRVDDQFLAAATVQGTVTSDATGAPVEGVCVEVLLPTDDPDNRQSVGQGCSGADGTYSVDLSDAGEFIAEFTDPQGNYTAEFSGNTRTIGAAARFSVTRGTPTTVNASLARAAVITGLAVDAKTGAPIEGACPNAFLGHSGGYVLGSVPECSGPDGRWTVRGLPTGQFAISIDAYGQPQTYTETWAFKATSQATADLISVTAGATKSVRAVHVAVGGTVAGVITGPDGHPVADAWVNVGGGFPGRAGPGEGRWSAKTDEQGRYTVNGVPAGTYKAFVYTDDYWGDLAPEWSGNATTAASASTFKVKAQKTTRFDAQLEPASGISGSVVDAAGSPVTGYLVGQVFASDGSPIADFDVFGGDNAFETSALPAGDFTLKLTEYTDEGEGAVYWYDSATNQRDATRVHLGVGEHREITIHLP
jgi:hypothetical protein